jgi:hypothetical protein
MRPIYFHAFYLFACFIGFNHAVGQKIIKNTLKLNDEITTYYTIQPKEDITGIVLLLPGRGESPRQVLKNTSLPDVLAAKGYLVMIPGLHYSLFADETIKAQITEILRTQLGKYHLNKPNLFIGGFSAGGTVAMSYSEFLLSYDSATSLKGIFVIDSPLDLGRLYTSSERMLKYNCSDLIQKEGKLTKQFLDKSLGGSPGDKRENYLALSPYSANSSDGGNAKWLKNIAVRLYTEPDLQFVQKRYCEALRFEDINAVDLEKLNKFLVQTGNNKTEYITTAGKGFHSWNILDPIELTEWIIKVSKR